MTSFRRRWFPNASQWNNTFPVQINIHVFGITIYNNNNNNNNEECLPWLWVNKKLQVNEIQKSRSF